MPAEQLIHAAREPANCRFIEAWVRWRGAHLLPDRHTLGLAEIKPLLNNIVLLEVQDAEHIHIHVAGAALRDYLGFEIAGTNYQALAPPQDRPARYYRLRKMIEVPCGGCMRYSMSLPNREVMSSEVVSLPIASGTPSAARFVLSNVVPLARPPASVATPAERILDLADEFRFLDIGAGVPGTIEP